MVTGMSGAGRSTALHVLDDLGFFCVDNLPPRLVPELVSLLAQGPDVKHAAFGIDVRTRAFFEGADAALDTLGASGHHVEVIYLDASEEALVRRFSETRRPHPLSVGGSILDGIQREREQTSPLRSRAQHVIDTSKFSVHDLRRTLVDFLSSTDTRIKMVTRVLSFGFKYGIPLDADLVFDVRFLPNPHFVPELKPLTGLDKGVADFVMNAPETGELMRDIEQLLQHTLPRYEREGKSHLTVAIGCTGGRHRSVAITEALAKSLRVQERAVVAEHRDADRRPTS